MAEQQSEISLSQSRQATQNGLSLPSSNHLLTIKLNHEIFLLWKTQIVLFLKGHQVFHLVDGSVDVLSPENDDPVTLQRTDQALLSILISSLSENLIAHVLEANTSRELWLILEELFYSSSQAKVMQIQWQLTTLKKGSEPIAEYFQKAKLLRDTLAAAGKILSNNEFTTYLLAGLCSDYDSIVTSITTQVNQQTD